jgi:hypothetical protein
VVSAASASSSDALATAEASGDYFATEAHYRSLAGRIVAALADGAGFVLVTGDSPACVHSLSKALRKAADARYAVVVVPCESELTCDELARIPGGSTAAAYPASNAPASLFVLDGVDRLSEQRIKGVCEAVLHGSLEGAAFVLLTGSSFLRRLAEPSLQFLQAGIAARFRLQEVGGDEIIEFLRHQAATRQSEVDASRTSPSVLRVFGSLGALAVLGISALLFLHFSGLIGNPNARSSTGASSSHEASMPQPSLGEVTNGTPPGRTPAAEPAPPTQFADAQPLSPTEIAALMARGDRFLSAGDLASARLFYQRAAEAGDRSAALRLAATFDLGFLGRAGIRGSAGDPAEASSWYRRAVELGSSPAGAP